MPRTKGPRTVWGVADTSQKRLSKTRDSDGRVGRKEAVRDGRVSARRETRTNQSERQHGRPCGEGAGSLLNVVPGGGRKQDKERTESVGEASEEKRTEILSKARIDVLLHLWN